MSEVYDGNDWKNVDCTEYSGPTRRTRAQQQAKIDRDYVNQTITRDEWRRLTDELSSQRWHADGQHRVTTSATPAAN